MSDSITIEDQDMVIQLHYIASVLESTDSESSLTLRRVADRLAELTKKAADRRHWTGAE